jgi:hypothetical protein
VVVSCPITAVISGDRAKVSVSRSRSRAMDWNGLGGAGALSLGAAPSRSLTWAGAS